MVRILTDSTSDILPEEAKQLGTELIPLTVNFGEKSYVDGVDLTSDGFFELLEHSDALPFTSQPSPEDFIRHFEAAENAGDELVAVLISSELSGTLAGARIAKDSGPFDGVYIVDSRNVTIALGLIVRELVAYRDAHPEASGADIAQEAERLAANACLYGIVDTLKYLRKGGRLSAAGAAAGAVLGIKPVLQIKDGKVTVIDKVRGAAAANARLIEIMKENLRPECPCCVGYTRDRSAADRMTAGLAEMGVHPSKTVGLGSVLGTHVGPGACAVAFISDAAL